MADVRLRREFPTKCAALDFRWAAGNLTSVWNNLILAYFGHAQRSVRSIYLGRRWAVTFESLIKTDKHCRISFLGHFSTLQPTAIIMVRQYIALHRCVYGSCNL